MNNSKPIKLGDVCSMSAGGTPSRAVPDYYRGEIPWAKISDIEAATNGLIGDTEEKITEDALKSIRNRIFPADTLLLALYGSVGKVAITTRSIATNQAILGIRPKEQNTLDLRFLKYWFDTIRENLLNRAVGGTLQNISLGIVKDLDIQLPPLAIQQKIAAILDKADALRQKDKQLLAKYDELAQAVFYDMFGDPVKNERGWEVKPLKSFIDSKRDISYGIVQRGNHVATGIPVIRIRDVVDNTFDINRLVRVEKKLSDSYSRTILKGGELLISIRGTVGKIAIVPEHSKGWNVTREVAIIPLLSNYPSLYFKALLTNASVQNIILRDVKGVAQSGVNLRDFRELKVPFPPQKQLMQFINCINKVNKQRLAVLIQLQKSEELFQSLLQKAFNGELVK